MYQIFYKIFEKRKSLKQKWASVEGSPLPLGPESTPLRIPDFAFE